MYFNAAGFLYLTQNKPVLLISGFGKRRWQSLVKGGFK
jgi:hypothetical protein